jgi:hypothetical protein
MRSLVLGTPRSRQLSSSHGAQVATNVLSFPSAVDMATMAFPYSLRLDPPRTSRGAPVLRTGAVIPSIPQSAIGAEIRYLGVRLLAPVIILAVFVLCLLPSIGEELIEYGWPHGAFKCLVIGCLAGMLYTWARHPFQVAPLPEVAQVLLLLHPRTGPLDPKFSSGVPGI